MYKLGNYLIVKPTGERLFLVDNKENQTQEYMYTLQKQLPGVKIITDAKQVPGYVWSDPKSQGWEIQRMANINTTITEDSLTITAGEEELTYSKGSILKTVNDIIQTKNIGKLMSWVGLAGGKRKLVDLLTNLSKSFKVEIPDEFFDLLDEASKDWNKIPQNKYIRTQPWSSYSKESMITKVSQFEEDAKILGREANIKEFKIWLKADEDVDQLSSTRSWKKIEEKYNDLVDEVQLAITNAHKTKNTEDQANLEDLSHHLAQLWNTYLSHRG